MPTIKSLAAVLQSLYPSQLAEEWDNVGLLIGNKAKEVQKVMTCLTVTNETADEAAVEDADLIISHHPFPFKSEKRWTTDTFNGSIIHKIIQADVSVFSPHTAHDSAFWGINRQLAEMFELREVKPLYTGSMTAEESMLRGISPKNADLIHPELGAYLGTGRIGNLPTALTLSVFLEKTGKLLNQSFIPYVGNPVRLISRVAIGCGAADDFIPAAVEKGADLLLLGESRFHGALLAEGLGLSLALPGHYATERFAMETMAHRLSTIYPDLTIWASRSEKDPIQYAYFGS